MLRCGVKSRGMEEKSLREIDKKIAEKVFGLEVRRIKPDWYRYEVLCFYEPGYPLMVYSFDQNGCNARMYRNGIDERDGIASTLPFWSQDIADAWEVVEHFKKQDYMVSVNVGPEAGWWCCMYPPAGDFIETESCESAPLAICRAALQAAEGREVEQTNHSA